MAANMILSILIQVRDAASAGIKAVGQAVHEMGGQATSATGQVAGFGAATASAAGSASSLGLSVGLWSTAISAGVEAIRSGITAARDFVTGTVDVAAQFESWRDTLDTLTDGQGAETLAELNDWAKDMPIRTEAAIGGFNRLRAMGLDPTIDRMTTLVDTTGALDGKVDTFNGISNALGQIATKGKVGQEELLQLAERGVPIFEILREKLQLTQEQMTNIGNAGIDASAAIDAIFAGLAERFGGQADKMSRQWSGMVEALEAEWVDFERLVGEAGFLDFLKEQLGDVLAEIKSLASTGQLKAWAEGISNVLIGLGQAVSYVLGVLGRFGADIVSLIGVLDEFRLVWQLIVTTLAAPYLNAALVNIIATLSTFGKALVGLAIANPILGGILALLALIPIAMDLWSDSSQEQADSAGKTREALDKEIQSLEELERRLLGTAQGTEGHIAAEQELAMLLPQGNVSLDERGRVLARVTAATDENAKKLRELIALKQEERDAWLAVQIERTATALDNARKSLGDYTQNLREWYGVGEKSKDWAASFWSWLNKLTGTYDKNIQKGEELRGNLSKIGDQYETLLKSAQDSGLSVQALSRLLDRAGASGQVKEQVLDSYRRLIGVLDETGQAATRQARVVETEGAQAYDRAAKKAESAYQKKKDAAKTAYDAEIEAIGKLKVREDEEAAQRLAADQTFYARRVSEAQGHYQTLAGQLAAHYSQGEITQSEYQSRIAGLERRYTGEYSAILAERAGILRGRLAEAEKAYDAYLAKINAAENAALSDEVRRESQLADIRQRGMDDAGRDRDNLARINAYLAASEEALATSTGLSGKEREQAQEQARMYAEQATSLSGRLGNVAVAARATNASFDQMAKIKATSLEDLTAEAATSKTTLETLRTEMQNVTAEIEALGAQTLTLAVDPAVAQKLALARSDIEAFAKDASKDVKVTVNADTATARSDIEALGNIETASDHVVSDNVATVLQDLQSLNNQNTSSTHTVYVRKVEANSAGGLIGDVLRYAAGGWHRAAGLLPGYGGGDRRRALLEDGEFVVDKRTTRLFGPDFFYALQAAARSGLGAIGEQLRSVLAGGAMPGLTGYSLGGVVAARVSEISSRPAWPAPILALATGGLVPAAAAAGPDLGRLVIDFGGGLELPVQAEPRLLDRLTKELRRAKLMRKL